MANAKVLVLAQKIVDMAKNAPIFDKDNEWEGISKWTATYGRCPKTSTLLDHAKNSKTQPKLLLNYVGSLLFQNQQVSSLNLPYKFCFCVMYRINGTEMITMRILIIHC